MSVFLGFAAAIAILVGHFFYISDILKGAIQPQVSTWLVIQMLTLASIATQISSGSLQSSWGFIAGAVTGTLICVLAFKTGRREFRLFDALILSLSVLGMVLWKIIGDQVFATVATSFVISLAYLPTFKKAYTDPFSENILQWAMSFIATVLIVASIEDMRFVSAFVPVTWLVFNATLSILVWTGQKNAPKLEHPVVS